MPMYRIPVICYATAYIRADNPREAENIARQAIPDACIEVAGSGDNIEVGGGPLCSMGDVSLSSAMTLELASDAEVEDETDEEDEDG